MKHHRQDCSYLGGDKWSCGATFDSPDCAAPPLVDEVAAMLRTTCAMLAYEATCHEESGDEQRRKYVAPLRAQCAAVEKLLAKVAP